MSLRLEDVMTSAEPPSARHGLHSWADPFSEERQIDEPEAIPVITATPFEWIEPHKLSKRQWLYGTTFIRRLVSTTIGAGGVAKSLTLIVDALAMASGRRLLHDHPHQRCRVWLWNGEDPMDELQRRIAAAAKHHAIMPDELAGWLFVNSGRDTEIILATQDRNGTTVARPVVDAVIKTIQANNIDVVVIDPFVSSHGVPENDNGAIDRVVKTWAMIADVTGCAVHLVHHSRKVNGQAVEVDDARGASALINAVRMARTLNVMSADEATRAGVENRFQYVRVDDGKANLSPRSDKTRWHQIVSIPLGNGPMGSDGDFVGVVSRWYWPDPTIDFSIKDLIAAQQALENRPWRKDVQCNDWVGYPIAEALGIDLNSADRGKAARVKVASAIARWIEEGWLEIVQIKDAKSNYRPHVQVAKWPTESVSSPPEYER